MCVVGDVHKYAQFPNFIESDVNPEAKHATGKPDTLLYGLSHFPDVVPMRGGKPRSKSFGHDLIVAVGI